MMQFSAAVSAALFFLPPTTSQNERNILTETLAQGKDYEGQCRT